MAEQSDIIRNLSYKIDKLLSDQASLTEQAKKLKSELNDITSEEVIRTLPEKIKGAIPAPTSPLKLKASKSVKDLAASLQTSTSSPEHQPSDPPETFSPIKTNLEKFIGENLINKIGILITIMGVAIGAKYSIDNGLINPATRIIIGYLIGIGLLVFGMKLKTEYENYSSVLVSGGMTILYFITYLGYSLYGLFPQLMAFGLMLFFTAFTVYAALNYKKQIIALLGLVGAYAVPFLLSTGSGRVDILFSYMAILNLGILVISLTQNWRALFYSAFGLTWLIFCGWYLTDYNQDTQFIFAFVFLSLFFAIFYATFIGYKLKYKMQFSRGDIIILLFNSFIFFGMGYLMLLERSSMSDYLGLFTLINAVIHFSVSTAIYKLKLADRNLFFLISGLVLVFITIAIPVQLDGNWVTLLWIAEAALLFWIGRTKNVPVYETLSYPLIVLATVSLLQDWGSFYMEKFDKFGLLGMESFTPIFNIHFASSLLFVICLAAIYYIWRQDKYETESIKSSSYYALANRILPVVLFGVFYFMFFLEISTYWTQLLNASKIIPLHLETEYYSPRNMDFREYRSIWLVLYTLVIGLIASVVNIKWLKNKTLGKANLGFNLFAIAVFLTLGLYALSELRESYIDNATDEYFNHGWWNIGIRYLALTFFGVFIATNYQYIKQSFIGLNLKQVFDVVLHISIVWVLSSELLSIMNFSGNTHNYKLGLSILWGLYSLTIVAYGIWKDNAFLRIGAIGLFALTLVKVFFYDISHLDTIAKTIVFVSLGLLLLVISFLYNKYKDNITYDEK
jgi:uncharacterized membrane protein